MLTHCTIEITPDLARHLLAAGGQSPRMMQSAKIIQMAEDILAGRWDSDRPSLAKSPILISSSGRVMDGNHRLSAIALADVPVKMLICGPANADWWPARENT